MYNHGEGVSQDYFIAFDLFFQLACNGGDGMGCNNLGVLYISGLGVRTDFKKARELYNKSCNMGEAEGCSNLELYNRRYSW